MAIFPLAFEYICFKLHFTKFYLKRDIVDIFVSLNSIQTQSCDKFYPIENILFSCLIFLKIKCHIFMLKIYFLKHAIEYNIQLIIKWTCFLIANVLTETLLIEL